jgi:hypothetical protein
MMKKPKKALPKRTGTHRSDVKSMRKELSTTTDPERIELLGGMIARTEMWARAEEGDTGALIALSVLHLDMPAEEAWNMMHGIGDYAE